MNKPNGYDEVKAGGDFTPVELGGHYAIIKQVSETKDKNGNDMIVVLFDFCKPDAQEGYFTKMFSEDDRDGKKWPFAGTNYIQVNDYANRSTTSKSFKSFCSCVEKSNNMSITWGSNGWGKQFVNKKIGTVYGLAENEYNGNVSMRSSLRWFCNWDAVSSASIPQPKYLKKTSAAQTFTEDTSADSDLPF